MLTAQSPTRLIRFPLYDTKHYLYSVELLRVKGCTVQLYSRPINGDQLLYVACYPSGRCFAAVSSREMGLEVLFGPKRQAFRLPNDSLLLPHIFLN